MRWHIYNKIKYKLRHGKRQKLSASYREVDRAELAFYVGMLREGMVAFDIGANVGQMTLIFSTMVGDTGCVHAFEATKAYYDRLVAMRETIGRSNIILNHCAVADRDGYLNFHVYEDSLGGFNTLAERPLKNYGIDAAPAAIEKVPSTKIDTYCGQHKIERIHLLKIDVEGAEYQVLQGARRMLSEQRIECSIFEFGQTTFDMGNNPRQIEDYLHEVGYKVRNLIKGDPLFPGGDRVETARFSMHVATPRRKASISDA